MIRRLALASVAALFLSGLAAAPASADPKAQTVPLTCDGVTYSVAVNGNGAFTPAHDTASTRMFIPVWFGEFHGVLTDAEGNVLEEFTEPPASKGAGKNAEIECTFEFEETFEDPELGPGTFTFTGSGSVSGFVTPRH